MPVPKFQSNKGKEKSFNSNIYLNLTKKYSVVIGSYTTIKITDLYRNLIRSSTESFELLDSNCFLLNSAFFLCLIFQINLKQMVIFKMILMIN